MVFGISIEQPADVLVVGAGVAGLVVVYRLQQWGIPVTVMEARDRPGGRIHSVTHALGKTLTAELGGEAFDSDNVACLNLAQAFGLPVVDLTTQVSDLTAMTFWLGGRAVAQATLQAELTEHLKAHRQDWETVQRFMQTGIVCRSVQDLDVQSISDYVSGWGASAALRQEIAIAYSSRYGVEAEHQSSLNFLSFFRCLTDCESFFGVSDERFYIQGGNHQLTRALYERVADRVQFGTALVAIAETRDRRYRVTLQRDNTYIEQDYNQVVLTLPFSVLRQLTLRVDLPQHQRQVIQHLRYNTPCKLITAYAQRPWQPLGETGLIFTDLPFQHCWEASDSLGCQEAALLVMYPAGSVGRAIAAPDGQALVETCVDSLWTVCPTAPTTRYPVAPLQSDWVTDPYALGAYSYYGLGQWSAFYGAEGQRCHNLFFAGEHCSRQFQGYMEGACETAEQVALEILTDWQCQAGMEAQRSRLQHYAKQRRTGWSSSEEDSAVGRRNEGFFLQRASSVSP
jgi:monoamine oxidase